MGHSEGVGRSGEFLAASILEAHGIRASHVAIHGTDLWVETPSGRMLRVQVKTASKPVVSQHWRGPCYRFQNQSRASLKATPPDIYCLVALDVGVMLVFPKMAKGGTRLAVHRFTEEAQEAGIKEHLY
jgi:hypothetical protein